MKLLSFLLLILLALQNTQQQQQNPAQAEVPKATLRGRVYAQDTGAPLKRAQLSLRSQGGPQSDPFTAITDAQGAYELKNVPAGNYTLYCSRSGFVSVTYGQKSPNQPPVPLTVQPGQELKGLDFRLIRGGVISGTVLDEDGEPLSNVQVQTLVTQYTRGQSRLMPRGSASSDDRGQFRIFNLPPGRYYVQAIFRSFGDQPASFAPIFFPNALTPKDAQRIEVPRGGEVPRVDFHMRSVPTYSVSGKVIDLETGEPVKEGTINVTPMDAITGGFGYSIGGFGYGQLRPDGTFRVRGLLSGRHRLLVMRPERSGSGTYTSSRAVVKTIELGAADLENVVVTVGPGVTVRGRIIADGGTISPEGLRVNLSPKTDGTFGPTFGGGSTIAKNDLTFEIPNVQPGEYTLSVFSSRMGFTTAPGLGMAQNTGFYLREVRAGGENVVEKGLAVPEGAPVPDLELVLDFSGGSLTGRTLSDAGEPISGVQIALVSADREKRTSDRYFRTGTADQNGNYTLRALIPGDYLLVVWPESDVGRILDPDLFVQLEKHAVRVRVEKSATTNQDVKLTSDIKTIAQNFAQ